MQAPDKEDSILLNDKAQTKITDPDAVVIALGLQFFKVADAVDVFGLFNFQYDLPDPFHQRLVGFTLF